MTSSDANAGTRSLLAQADEVSALARQAFASGNLTAGVAAIVLAAQIVQLAKIQEGMNER